MEKNKAFTLIELLVVIAIIGLLSSVIMASLNSARKKGRDARRLQDIQAIQKALELYYDDNGYYPNIGWSDAQYYSSSWNTLASRLSPYLNTLPKDPLNQRITDIIDSYTYSYYSSGYRKSGQTNQQWYMIVFRLENGNTRIEGSDGVKACNGTNFNYGNSRGNSKIITVGGNCID